ncbi:MAG: antibiotic biosynthesis monooxygenase [Pseudomonadota bacterium]
MQDREAAPGPILRLFEVQARPGCAAELLRKFAVTSADVVRGEPGNKGYFFGAGVPSDGDFVVFASVWTDLDAVRARFGEDWQESFLPEGYDQLIERCSVRHVDLNGGWHVDPDT